MRAPNLAIPGAFCLFWSLVATGATPLLPDSIQACKRETDNERRLQCYDREVAKFPLTQGQALGLSESQVAAAQSKASAAQSNASAAQPKPSAAQPEDAQVSAKVVALTEPPHSGFVITLDNGQVWVQNEMETGTFADVGDVVTIKRSKVGSFWLQGPSGRRTRVHRYR
jgi:hypothetical protein